VAFRIVSVGRALAVGCQLGSRSPAGTGVGSRVTPVPSGFMTKMSWPFGASKPFEEKTIFVPSGDQAGRLPASPSSSPVSGVCPLPSAFMTQICPSLS
jgi:hypothetical protein